MDRGRSGATLVCKAMPMGPFRAPYDEQPAPASAVEAQTGSLLSR